MLGLRCCSAAAAAIYIRSKCNTSNSNRRGSPVRRRHDCMTYCLRLDCKLSLVPSLVCNISPLAILTARIDQISYAYSHMPVNFLGLKPSNPYNLFWFASSPSEILGKSCSSLEPLSLVSDISPLDPAWYPKNAPVLQESKWVGAGYKYPPTPHRLSILLQEKYHRY